MKTLAFTDPNRDNWSVILEEGHWHVIRHLLTEDVLLEHLCPVADSWCLFGSNKDGLCYACQEQAPEALLAVWRFAQL